MANCSATTWACGLACRDWLPSSRDLLFAEVAFNDFNISSLFAIEETSPFPLRHLFRSLDLRTKDGSPALGILPNVRDLKVQVTDWTNSYRMSLAPLSSGPNTLSTRSATRAELSQSVLFRHLQLWDSTRPFPKRLIFPCVAGKPGFPFRRFLDLRSQSFCVSVPSSVEQWLQTKASPKLFSLSIPSLSFHH
ncbi:hypothetical protein DFH07DRAFT_395965 [Mycena maculata]|uniref:Uncharacterized protein n=1 Tax=Mycena maculata TaxID=230809 RepID=A0AAD7JF58_9AGAR|nr:hypothetical protein DFH07DRAFT_395965 [Mycena maculata]